MASPMPDFDDGDLGDVPACEKYPYCDECRCGDSECPVIVVNGSATMTTMICPTNQCTWPKCSEKVG